MPLWEDALPNVTDEELADAARRVAAGMEVGEPFALPGARG
jgi:hypothetical protein